MYAGPVDNVAACLSKCRFQLDENTGSNGYDYAGLTWQKIKTLDDLVPYRSPRCYCGNQPDNGFYDLYTWPYACNTRCPGKPHAFWENCGGRGRSAMSVWSVPPNPKKSDLNGLCVYDYPARSDDHPNGQRVCSGKKIESEDMTIELCKGVCRTEGHGS